MNSQPGNVPGATVRASTSPSHRFGRALALLGLLALAGSLFTGCARIKQYSLDSWQGTLPMRDLRYVQGDP